MRVKVHIDRLVLDGVRRHQGHSVARALERELTRLLKTGELPRAGTPRAAATIPHSPAPAALGTEAARAIHQGWKK